MTKPFDLQKAIEGHPLCTRDGRDVTEFYYLKTAREEGACVAVIEREPLFFYEDGSWIKNTKRGIDLFLKSEKKKLFVAIYKDAEQSSNKWHINATYSCTDMGMLKSRYDLSEKNWQIVEVEIECV